MEELHKCAIVNKINIPDQRYVQRSLKEQEKMTRRGSTAPATGDNTPLANSPAVKVPYFLSDPYAHGDRCQGGHNHLFYWSRFCLPHRWCADWLSGVWEVSADFYVVMKTMMEFKA